MEEPAAATPNPYRGRFHRSTGLRRSVLVMAALTVILIVLLAAAVFSTARRYRQDQAWTLHTYQVREAILQLVNNLHVAEMEARSYGLTGRDAAFQQYWHSIGAVDRATDGLAELVTDNPVETATVQQLRDAITAQRSVFENILTEYRSRGPAAAHADVVALVSEPT